MSSRIRGADRARQTGRILMYGHPVDNPCEYCSHQNQGCIMDTKNRNCAACTKRGRKCEKRFHNNKEWEQFEKDEIETTRQLNEALAEQATLSARIARLFKQQEFLRSKGKRMLDHDTVVMDQLDEEELSSSLGLSPNQLLEQISPGLWSELDIVAITDHNPEVVAGNSSDCR
jgi:hypothetical protein